MKTKFLLAAAATLLASSGAFAQSAGSFIVHAGGAQVSPDVDSSDLTVPSLVGTKFDVKKASAFVGGVTYFTGDHLSFDLSVAAPFKHDVLGAGAIAGTGRLATVKSQPISLLAQYRFGNASSALRPFVGAGVTYHHLSRSKATAALSGISGGSASMPTTLAMKSRLGPTVEVGAAYNVTRDWSASLSVGKTLLKTTGTLSTGQTFETSLDPVTIKFAIGYRF
ncbi:OmpW/AlkL family protein [Roseateles sp. LYH14W]|uniref:OmpW family protein n=1 Tax=Pelomonas parva TaxID=3299032 RepID=A0ABW7F162_9BURK